MSKVIVGSSNISLLDFRIENNLCDGKIYITPQFTFIGTGATSILGAKVQILKEGIEVKSYELSYDFTNPYTTPYQYSIPIVNGGYDYGNYEVEVTVYDTSSKNHTLSKSYSLCKPTKNGNTTHRKLGVSFKEDCSQGKLFISLNQPSVYKGLIQESSIIDYDIEFPFGNLPKLNSTSTNSVVQLFEGEYKVKGDMCVTYNAGNSIYYNLPYLINCLKKVKCQLDYCCVFTKMASIYNELESCGNENKEKASAILAQSTMLLTIIEKGLSCGESVSEYIQELEDTLGIKCMCGLEEGTPIINPNSGQSFIVNGCHVTSSTSGLVTTYTIGENYKYIVEAHPTQNFFTVSTPQLNGCTMKQVVSFDISKLYLEIKGQIVNTTEYNYWAGIINNTLGEIPVNLLTCLNLTNSQWNNLSFRDKFIAVLTKMCSCCSSVTCNAILSNLTIEKLGNNVKLKWVNNASVYKVEIYIDGNFIDSVLAPLNEYQVVGGADGVNHKYEVISYCESDIKGNGLSLTETVFPCPFIPAPIIDQGIYSVTQNCPFNVAQYVEAAPNGFSNVYFTSNNTSGTTVSNPTALPNGDYWVFRKQNNTNCYSQGVLVSVSCRTTTLCEAPPSVTAIESVGGILVHFPSAINPPPTYLVRRKLASASDTLANYTTIGTPTFSSINSRWEILDTTAAIETLYTYAVVSLCGVSESKITTEAAILPCGTVSVNRNGANIEYSFVQNSGSVTAVSIELLNETGTTSLAQAAFSQPFTNPTTGTFLSIAPGLYKIRKRIFIGTYDKVCPLIDIEI